jgi:hypothetical protein
MAVWIMPLKTEGHTVEDDKVKKMKGEGVKRQKEQKENRVKK